MAHPHSRPAWATLVALLLAGPLPAAPPGSPPPAADPLTGLTVLQRNTLVRAVLDRNPTLEAARQAVAAMSERVPQAGSLPDPVLSLGLGPASVLGSGIRAGEQVRLAQRLPYPGRLPLREQAARGEATAAAEAVEALRLELATRAVLLFADDYVVHRAIEINREHRDLLEQYRRIATARYAAGAAAEQDPLAAEVEAARLLHRGVELETERRVLAAGINALLHRSADAPLPDPPRVLSRPAAEPRSAGELREVALEHRPELRRIRAEARAREAAVALARLERRPDFEATTVYNSMWNPRQYRFMVGVGVRLPIFGARIRAGVAEAEARLGRARAEEAATRDRIASEVSSAAARSAEADHVLVLFADRLLPAVRDQVRAALTGFESGASSFLALIDAERSQRSLELEYQEALADVYRRRAELDRVLGVLPFPDAQPAAPPAPAPTAKGDPS